MAHPQQDPRLGSDLVNYVGLVCEYCALMESCASSVACSVTASALACHFVSVITELARCLTELAAVSRAFSPNRPTRTSTLTRSPRSCDSARITCAHRSIIWFSRGASVLWFAQYAFHDAGLVWTLDPPFLRCVLSEFSVFPISHLPRTFLLCPHPS